MGEVVIESFVNSFITLPFGLTTKASKPPILIELFNYLDHNLYKV